MIKKLLGNVVLVKEEVKESVSESGIILGESNNVFKTHVVLQIGDGVNATGFKVGDRVLLSSSRGQNIGDGIIIPAMSVVAVIG